MRRRGLFGLSVLAVVLTAGVGVVLWQAVEPSSVSRVSAEVNQLKPIASVVRLALIGLVAVLWPKFVWEIATVGWTRASAMTYWRSVGG